jgi:hypothetical protein
LKQIINFSYIRISLVSLWSVTDRMFYFYCNSARSIRIPRFMCLQFSYYVTQFTRRVPTCTRFVLLSSLPLTRRIAMARLFNLHIINEPLELGMGNVCIYWVERKVFEFFKWKVNHFFKIYLQYLINYIIFTACYYRLPKCHKLLNSGLVKTSWFAYVIASKTQKLSVQPNRSGIPNLFWMATHLTKPPRFRDTPFTVRPPPSTRLEKKIHNYIIKTNKANLTARFSYLIMSKAELRLMTSDFKI